MGKLYIPLRISVALSNAVLLTLRTSLSRRSQMQAGNAQCR